VNSKLKRYIKLILKLAISCGALYFVFTKIDINNIAGLLKSSNFLLLLAAMALFILSKLISSFRLNNYFKSITIHISEKNNLKLYLLGMFYNIFLPGGIGGDGYKIYYLNKKYNVKAGKIFRAVLLDRVTGIIALLCLIILLFYLIPGFIFYKLIIWLAIPVICIVYYLIIMYFFNYFLNILLKTWILSLLVQALQVLSAFLILYAFNTFEHTVEYLIIFLISSIAAILPVTIGGAGIREITFLYGAQLLNLDINTSVTLSLMFYLITVIVSFGGIYYSLKPIHTNT